MLGKPSLGASARVMALACLFALVGLWVLGCAHPSAPPREYGMEDGTAVPGRAR